MPCPQKHMTVCKPATLPSPFRAKEAYDKLLFREVLKAAAYDLGNARDVYRHASDSPC